MEAKMVLVETVSSLPKLKENEKIPEIDIVTAVEKSQQALVDFDDDNQTFSPLKKNALRAIVSTNAETDYVKKANKILEELTIMAEGFLFVISL